LLRLTCFRLHSALLTRARLCKHLIYKEPVSRVSVQVYNMDVPLSLHQTHAPMTIHAGSIRQCNGDTLTMPLHRTSSKATISASSNTRIENNISAQPLLDSEKAANTPPGWPTSPNRTKTSVYVNFMNGAFDALLLACSVAFLVFALIVNNHDQAPTAQYPRLTKTLVNATKYVSHPTPTSLMPN
jgi:hypothetical protein